MVTEHDHVRIFCVCTNLKIAARATGRRYDRALAQFDLNTMQFAILSIIARRGSMPSMALSKRLSLERTSLYRGLAVLERRGLVGTEPGHGREQILFLTDSGKALLAEARQVWTDVQDAFIAAFGEDWEELLAMVERVRSVAEDVQTVAEGGK